MSQYFPLKVPLSVGEIRHLVHSFLDFIMPVSPQPRRHLNMFIRFAWLTVYS